MPEDFVNSPKIVGDLVPKSTVILVIPIDKEAPKGRIILPQVQTLRDLLDNNCLSYVVKESELKDALDNLKTPPALVVTDSQAFKKVSEIVPENVPEIVPEIVPEAAPAFAPAVAPAVAPEAA